MSTIYVFQSECPARSTVPAPTDKFLVYNATSGRAESVTASLMAEGGRSVTAGTTLAAFAATGVTLTQTTLGAFTLTDPTQAGMETTIIFPTSTGIHTVAPVAATIGGSTVTVGGATKITHAGTSDALGGSITLIATSTSKWYIKSMVAGVGITTT